LALTVSLQAKADEVASGYFQGKQTVGLMAGPMLPIRFSESHRSKLFGGASAASWTRAFRSTVGSDWYQGRVSIGAEVLGFSTAEPIGAYGIGVTPKIVYSFTAFGRVRPYLEGGGGGVWTDLGGRTPEQPGRLNFLAWGGIGCAWALTPQWAVNAGYRFVHISNGGTRQPNAGLHFGLPFIGLSYSLF
jgi:opacity protein-like surface antigen